MEQECEAKSQHIWELLLDLFVNLVRLVAWFLSVERLAQEHQVGYEVLKLNQPLLNYLLGASLDQGSAKHIDNWVDQAMLLLCLHLLQLVLLLVLGPIILMLLELKLYVFEPSSA